MSKVKINSGLAAIMVIGGFIAGWQTMLLICAFLLLFAEIDDKVKDVMVKMITFAIGFYLLQTIVNIVFYGIDDIGMTALNDLNKVISPMIAKIDITKANIFATYVINPLDDICLLAKSIVNILIDLAQFGFIIAVIANKPIKQGGIMGKVNGYVKDAVNYVNNFGKTAPAQEAPQQPTQPTEPQAPVQQ